MKREKVITLCRYYPGNDFILATGVVVTASAKQYVLRIDRTEVVFPRPDWNEVIE